MQHVWYGALGMILLYLAALMTIWSMIVYMRIAYQVMLDEDKMSDIA